MQKIQQMLFETGTRIFSQFNFITNSRNLTYSPRSPISKDPGVDLPLADGSATSQKPSKKGDRQSVDNRGKGKKMGKKKAKKSKVSSKKSSLLQVTRKNTLRNSKYQHFKPVKRKSRAATDTDSLDPIDAASSAVEETQNEEIISKAIKFDMENLVDIRLFHKNLAPKSLSSRMEKSNAKPNTRDKNTKNLKGVLKSK